MTRKFTLAVLALVTLIACQKETSPPLNETTTGQIEKPAPRSNPLSLRNIEAIKSRINNSSGNTVNARFDFGSVPVEQQMQYLKIDPNNITTKAMEQIEADTTVLILDFPFANGEIYGDAYAFDETKRELLKDGFLYAVIL